MSTIAAISTAPGNAGIGIIRLSGDDCFKILQKIFKPKNKGEIKGYTIKYGNIVKNENDEIIDELEYIPCGNRNTSCPDQLSKAIKKYVK